MSQPILIRGHHNDAQWVEHAQKMLNGTRPRMSLDHLAENGVFDEAMESDVKSFQHRAGLQPVDGKIGPDTWAALWTAWNERQAENEAQVAKEEGMAPAPGHEQPEPEDPPPTRQEIDRGREVVDYHIDDIVERAKKFAEKVSGLEEHDVIPKLIDAVHTDVELLELTEWTEEIFAVGETVFVAGTFLAIAAPFAMWYEAIQANFAGQLTAYRWAVYRPWMDGYLAGLYGHGPGEVPQFFVPMRDHGYHASAGLNQADRKAVLALLVFASGSMGFVDEPDQLTAQQWAASKENRGWTYQGLEKVISGHDG